MKQEAPPSTSATNVGPRVAGAVILVVEAGLLLASLFDGSWAGGRAPVPYAWRDVALVHAVCALPLALMTGAFISGRVSPVLVVAVAAGSLAAGAVPFTEEGSSSLRNTLAEPNAGLHLRPLIALAWILPAALAGTILVRASRKAPPVRLAWKPVAALGVLGLAALTFPPATYVSARCRHDLAKFGELLGQSRVGEAHALADGLLVLDPALQWNGQPLPEVAAQIEQVVQELEARVATPLRAYATTAERVERARTLAMLGRGDEALEILAPVNDPGWTAPVELLRGTIHEKRAEWEEGLIAYRAARKAWKDRPPSPTRDAGVVQAATGVAYCLRKSGRYAEAEVAYLELLAISPTADTHFLLAQFYEDAQQAAKARDHARRAIQLAPERYGHDGAKLIQKLALNQFGCFGVYQAEGRSTPGEPKPDEAIRGIK